MKRMVFALAAGCIFFTAAQGLAASEACVGIDEAHDLLTPPERLAALVFLSAEVDRAGLSVVERPCANEYTVQHAALGNAIAVVLTGPQGTRRATALGRDDLPAVYNQMIRSLLTGKRMALEGVVDRNNVSETQANIRRVGADSIFYTKLGYGTVLGSDARGIPALTLLGYRHELDTLAVDVSFLGFSLGSSAGTPYESAASSVSTLLKLEVLHFTNRLANRSLYFGGGASYGSMSLANGERRTGPLYTYPSEGRGLAGELTAGYELGRASTVRVFAQADAMLPLYRLTSTTVGASLSQPYTSTSRYAPSVVLSLGVGWQRGGKSR